MAKLHRLKIYKWLVIVGLLTVVILCCSIPTYSDKLGRTFERRILKLVAYNIPRGCVAAYYPETNPLVPLSSVAANAGTPTSKCIPVLLLPHKKPETVAAHRTGASQAVV